MRKLYEIGVGVTVNAVVEGAETTLSSSIRKAINNKLNALGSYFKHIPLKEIRAILDHYGIIMVQEDGTEFEGMLSGSKSKANIDIAYVESYEYETSTYTPISNSFLRITWEKMSTGNFECTIYLS